MRRSSRINPEGRNRLRPAAASAEVVRSSRCLACIRLRVSELYRSPNPHWGYLPLLAKAEQVARCLCFVAKSRMFSMFNEPLCLFECACGLLPKDIDQLN
jgi:hypothetical protein